MVTWFNYFSIESNQVQAKELLAPFRKESQKAFDTFIEQDYTSVYPNTSSISTIEFDTTGLSKTPGTSLPLKTAW
jgi:hypothetical protein